MNRSYPLYKADQPIILASSSPIRLRMLRNAGVWVQSHPAAVDEAAVRESLLADGADPASACEVLAEMKARQVAEGPAAPPDEQASAQGASMMIGCDQIAYTDTAWLDKPDSKRDAAAQLAQLAGTSHSLVSCVVVFKNGARVFHAVDTVHVRMHPLSTAMIERYLAAAWPAVRGSVGSYHIEGLGVSLIHQVTGDHFTVMGLPLLPLLTYLRGSGILAS
ncbi:MAG: Maf family protein [Pseudomonadota bacterium]